MSEKKLTIGMATHDDFEGVFFTVQSLRLNNLERLHELDLVVIDNAPDSQEGKATAEFCAKVKARYIPERRIRSTAIRSRVFAEALAPWTLCMDPHVLLEAGTIGRLIEFAETRHESRNFYHGPMLYDDYLHSNPATHMDPVWRDKMFGTWGHDKRAKDPEAEPFEIPMHGLGLFTCASKAFPGFHPLFKGFGGEEGYVHEKVRAAGGNNFCLPWLRWSHRFQRPRGINYRLDVRERILNYLIGWLDLDKDPAEVVAHFQETHPMIPAEEILLPQAEDLLNQFKEDPEKAIARHHDERAPVNDEPPADKSEVVPFNQEALIAKANAKGVEAWHDTGTNFDPPLEIEILGRKLRVAHVSAKWTMR